MPQDPYKYFRVEARELVSDLSEGLLALEHRADAELVARLLRHAHTLKGAARIVKHRELADLAHVLEDLLEPLRSAPVAQRHDAALALIDRMSAQVAALSGVSGAAPPRAGDALPPSRTDTLAIDEALAGLAGIHALVARMRTAPDRVTASRLLDQIDRGLGEVRRDVEQLRLSAAVALFTPLERAARDAAVAAGKRVTFAGVGGRVRVDADVLGAVHPALVQLVRNAVVHGIEAPTERTRAGKQPDGHVKINVAHVGRRVAITCEDDGRGLDLTAIARAAERRGVVRERTEDPGLLFELLLRGGISTSEDVTELAGRGIGLDVVREAAQRLGGDVGVRTRPGLGTAITLTVPISVSAVPVVVVLAGERRVAILQASVRSIVRVRDDDIRTANGSMVLALDDAMVPCATLSSLLQEPTGGGRTALYVDGGNGVAAVIVDQVVGIEDVIVRTVPGGSPVDPIVLGFALDASGMPYPVVETAALVAATRSARVTTSPSNARALPLLVVDDSLTTRMLEQSILESAGFEVEVASSAEAALEKLARREYALMLVDVEMPRMDGFTLISTIRSRPATSGLPAILVTSRDAPADRRRGAEVGAQGYVVKSQFDQVELVAMIRRLVRK